MRAHSHYLITQNQSNSFETSAGIKSYSDELPCRTFARGTISEAQVIRKMAAIERKTKTNAIAESLVTQLVSVSVKGVGSW